jgi:hypothetical protein
MKTTDSCEELDDLVRIDLIPTDGSVMTIPFAVQYIAQLKGRYPNQSPLPNGSCKFADALLTLAVADSSEADALLTDKTKLTAAPSREAAGEVFTHTLECPIYRGYQAITGKLAAISGRDFFIVATCYDGRQYLSYTLPNTSQLNWKRSQTPFAEGTVTVTVKAMSTLILLDT